jgi:OFA family oxalate/formate antiporter-like MFS transporter
MIPGGRIQDRFGPRLGATLGGLCLAIGCILAGLMKSYLGLVLGFGLLGGMGMGFGYAAATPAAVRWFGPHQRGLVVGLVVGGYGGAAVYISPLARYLITNYGLSGSLIGLGLLFAVVVIAAGRLLSWPPAGYQPPAPPDTAEGDGDLQRLDTAASARHRQFYALSSFIGTHSPPGGDCQRHADAQPDATAVAFFAANAWLLSSYGLANATGRVARACTPTASGCATPTSSTASSRPCACCDARGDAIWQRGSVPGKVWHLAIRRRVVADASATADYYGSKNLGTTMGWCFSAGDWRSSCRSSPATSGLTGSPITRLTCLGLARHGGAGQRPAPAAARRASWNGDLAGSPRGTED